MNLVVDNSLLAFIGSDSDNDGFGDACDNCPNVGENKKNPNGFSGYIEFEFLELNGKPLSCTGPIKLTAIKSQGKNGKDIEFESEEIETKNNSICGTTDHFLYPVNINYYNSNGKLVFTQNTTFNLKSNFDGKGKKEEIFESSQVLSGAYKANVEQTEFDVILSSVGEEKLKVVQVLQTILKISEKEAFAIIANTPYTIKEKVSKEEANQLKAALEAVGATVDLK